MRFRMGRACGVPLTDMVKSAGARGWELIGVYRPHHLGGTWEDYVCFRKPGE
jgi:hypothetical protein